MEDHDSPSTERLVFGPAPCGYGFNGNCCCLCVYRLDAKPRCHHIGGKGSCGGHGLDTALGQLARAAKPESYVCMAFAFEGTVLTDWTEHGCCENFTDRRLPSAGSYAVKRPGDPG